MGSYERAAAIRAVPPALRRVRRPLSDEVRDAILADYISSGAIPPGERLPTEAEMCERYGVSRVTVRAALRSLQEAGVIVVRQGLGSTVMQADTITSGLDRLCSFETFARDAGREVDSAELEIAEMAADEQAAQHLDAELGTRVLVVRRIKLHDGVPVGWIVDYVPVEVLARDIMEREFSGSVLDILLAHPELDVEYSDCEVVPVNLDRALSRRLQVKTGTAALYLDEQTCTRHGKVVNWSQAWLLPERLRFYLRRRRQLFRLHG